MTNDQEDDQIPMTNDQEDDQIPMTNDQEDDQILDSNNRRKDNFDLGGRTFCFSKQVLGLFKIIPLDIKNRCILNQIIRSGTSVGANYCEADEAGSKKDFKYKIILCKKEARESNYWIRLLIDLNPNISARLYPILKESNELVRIFATIAKNTKV